MKSKKSESPIKKKYINEYKLFIIHYGKTKAHIVPVKPGDTWKA